jgi:hypothetical protein
MQSRFFKLVSKPTTSLDDEVSPDSGPAGAAPLAIIFGFLPKFIRSFLQFGVKMLQNFLNTLSEALFQSLKPKKGEEIQSNAPGREAYSTHASFDHLKRIEDLEQEMATRRGAHSLRRLPNVEHRIRQLEKKLNIGPGARM